MNMTSGEPMHPLVIECQHGLGDNIYARPFIRATAAVRKTWIETPWPELFADLPVRIVLKPSRLRTQAKNVARQRGTFHPAPVGILRTALRYGHGSLRRFGSITKAIEETLPLNGQPFVFDLPPIGSGWATAKFDRPIAIVRPVTARKEWNNTARNPLPAYVNQIADSLMSTHRVIAVADLEPSEEWLVGEMPPCHVALVKGELPVLSLLDLIASADVVVGGVGFIVPATIAAKTKAFIIGGGQGAHNGPAVITDSRMDLTRIHFATPEPQCGCGMMSHDCNKIILGLEFQWNQFCQRHGLRSSKS